MGFHVGNMTQQQQLIEARHVRAGNPNAITVVDKNGKTEFINTEILDDPNLNETKTKPKQIYGRLLDYRLHTLSIGTETRSHFDYYR